MPVPYMGSKRGSASRIINLIKAYEPEVDTLYDVFCGGFAVSEEALKKGFKVYSSDLDARVIALEKEVIYGRALDPETGLSVFEKPRFISREDFFRYKDREDWFGGYIQTIWSFGNKGMAYLFGKDVESMKKAGHLLAVDGKITPEILKVIPENICEKISRLPDWRKRRLAIRKAVAVLKKRGDLQRLQQLEQLQRLQRLEQLQRLQRLQQLECSSYDEVDIPAGIIIYCDPPYAGTAEYVEGGFDHEKFYDWCREKSKTNPVFISEYHCPEDFECIYEFSRRQTLSKGNTKFNEKVFYLRRQDDGK